MIIEHYGVRLKRLTKSDIELVRIWRNDRKIQQHMFFSETISAAMQEQWFKTINTAFNHFFIIEYNQLFVGLINASHIDYAEKMAEAGLFIFEDKYWGTDVPVRASLAMLDFFFHHQLVDTFSAKTKKENRAAILYNTQLGFLEKGAIEHGAGIQMELTKDNYYKKTALFRKVAGSEKMKIEFNRNDAVEMFFFEKYFQHIG